MEFRNRDTNADVTRQYEEMIWAVTNIDSKKVSSYFGPS